MNLYSRASGKVWFSESRGFTLLLAALTASIVLALASAIFKLAQKELILSSVGRDSQYAFYAADSGAECALYWDIRHQHFSTPPASVTCDQQTKTVIASNVQEIGEEPVVTTGLYEYQYDAGDYCVRVSVEKYIDDEDALKTTIHADGFSTLCDNIPTSPRVLQRSVELNY